MMIAIHAWQCPSVGGCAPSETTQGQKTSQEQFRNSSPLIAQFVGLATRRLGFGIRLSILCDTGNRSASALLFNAIRSILP